MDFIIADEIVIPKENFKHYTEKVLYLPHCYQANMSQREISKKQFKRIDLDFLKIVSFIVASITTIKYTRHIRYLDEHSKS